ncbi:hypothetical protein PRIPAC_89142, partial [Pristionchus pacificus]
RSRRPQYNKLGQRISRTTTNDEDDPDEITAKATRDENSMVEKTAIEDARFVQTDGDKEVLRERFTLDQTLTRYARWRKMRMDFAVYATLMMVSQMYLALGNVLATTSALKSRQKLDMQTPMCWCDNTLTIGDVNKYLSEVRPTTHSTILKIGFLSCGLSSVLWERVLGRRTSLLLALSISIVSLLIIHQTGSMKNPMLRHAAWMTEYVMSGAVLLIAYTSFVEVLPRKWRVVGAGIFQLASAFSDWVALFSIHLFGNIDYLLLIVGYRIVALSTAILFMKESISHLIVQGKYTEVDNVLCDEEIELNRKKRAKKGIREGSDGSSESEKTTSSGSTEGEISAELKQARMITDDLAYRDDEDYSPFEFIGKLPRSNVFYLLCVGFAIAGITGVMDRMTVIYLGQVYIDGEILLSIKFLIKTLSALILLFHRKWHRCRTMILLMAIAVLTMTIRLIALRLKTNNCNIRNRVT